MQNDSLEIDQRKKLPGTAAGQYRGYALQTVRVCEHLLAADEGDRVWLEHFDDVGTERSSMARLLEQSKSAASHNPVADWAEDLWKSLAHWLALCVSGRVDVATSRFRLYVVQNHTGEFVQRLHAARTPEDVSAICTGIEAAIRARGGMPKGAGPYVERFLMCDPGLRAAIVQNFELSTGDDDPIGELRGHFRNTVSDAVIDEVIDAALGWIKRRIEEQLKTGSTVWIEATRFKSWLKAWLRRHDRDHVLASLDHQIDAEMIASELKLRTYIRQLDAIDCAADDKVDAASDFLRAHADRTFWSEKGLIIEAQLSAFDDELEREWKRSRRLGDIADKDEKPEVRGRKLYYVCLGYQTGIDGRNIPRHLVPGGLHALAEVVKIGWHPEYQMLMSGGGDVS